MFDQPHYTLFENMFGVLGVVAGITTVGIFAIVLIAIMRPEKDNAALYTSILGFLAPTIVTLLALAQVQATATKVESLEVKVDGRLTELLQITAESSRATGELIGRDTIKQERLDADAAGVKGNK